MDVPGPSPAPEPDPYEVGGEAVSGILATTEVELAAMVARAEKAKAGVSAEVRLRVRERTAGDRMRLASLRHELIRQKDAVAGGFDSILSLLDEADRRLACNGEGADRIDSELDRPIPAVVIAAAGSSATRGPSSPGREGDGTASLQTRARWWHRWVRPAA
jgi:hypothetical protein